MRAKFRKFSKKISCIARARRGCAGLKGPRPDLTMTGRCGFSSSVGSSKIKFRTSFLLRDEVRILIFDDPSEKEKPQCPEFCSAQLYSMHYIIRIQIFVTTCFFLKSFTVLLADLFFANTRHNHRFYMTVLCQKPYLEFHKWNFIIRFPI